VAPTGASLAVTVPEIICLALLVSPPEVVIETAGGMVSSVNTTAVLDPVSGRIGALGHDAVRAVAGERDGRAPTPACWASCKVRLCISNILLLKMLS